MERISEELRLGSLQKDALGKAYGKLHSQAPSFLLFSVQWKDLDDVYESISKSLHDLAKSLCEREAPLQERSREVESKEKELSVKERVLLRPAVKVEEDNSDRSNEGSPKDVDFKTYQRTTFEISKKKDQIISLDDEVGGEEKELSSASAGDETDGELCAELGLPRQAQMATRLEEVRAMEEKLLSLQSSIQARSKELEDKDARLQLFQQSPEEHLSKLESKKTEFDRLTERIESLSTEQRMMMEKRDQCCRDIEAREKQYYSLKAAVEARSEILALKEKEFEQRMEEFKLGEQEFARASSAEVVSFSSVIVPQPRKGKKARPTSPVDEKSVDHPQPKLRLPGRLSLILRPEKV